MSGRGFTANGYLASRTDANQSDIVTAWRRLGYSVALLHAAGEGVFDLLVSKHGLSLLCEVKDGLKPPSAREFTDKQRKFNFTSQGMRCVVTCMADVMRAHDQFSKLLASINAAGIKLTITGNQERQYQPALTGN